MNDYYTKQQFIKANEVYLKGDIKTVRELADKAKKDLEKKYVSAEPLFKWIEPEWLARGIAEGAIAKKDSGYYPKAELQDSDELLGYRGRTPISQKKVKLDVSKFTGFLNRYERFKKEKDQIELGEKTIISTKSLFEDDIKECRACKGTDFWTRSEGGLVCSRCHPQV